MLIRGRNVNELWRDAATQIRVVGLTEESRNGPVLVAPFPVLSTYECPVERVLFDEARDANPFFHFFECLWMLSGRDDSAFLNTFVRDFGSRFAEPTGMLYGAYGFRWRHHFNAKDQIAVAIDRLQRAQSDRRVVLSMWDPETDLVDPELLDGPEPRDLPCNTHVYLRIRRASWGEAQRAWRAAGGRDDERNFFYDRSILDLTVCCRSNDVVWGAYGANAVHFSFLQEYIAGRLGVGVGRMHQLSNNWHAYTEVLDRYDAKRSQIAANLECDPYASGDVRPEPIGDDWANWDMDLALFMQDPLRHEYRNTWFAATAVPMWAAHERWRAGQHDEAVTAARMVAAADWSRAAVEWLNRRKK